MFDSKMARFDIEQLNVPKSGNYTCKFQIGVLALQLHHSFLYKGIREGIKSVMGKRAINLVQ